MFNDPTLCYSFFKGSVSSQGKILYQSQRLARLGLFCCCWAFFSTKTRETLNGILIKLLWDSSSSHIGFVPFNFLFEVSCIC